MEWPWAALFAVSSFFNGRAAWKLLLDWKGMATTCRFVAAAYARRGALPDEAALARSPAAPVFVHLVPAFEEPEIAHTLRALLASRYPDTRLHVVVVTKEAESRSPHPVMGVGTAEVVRRFRAELPPWQQKMLHVLEMPGEGRKAAQLNWALRPEFLAALLGDGYDPARVFVGVSDADSLPDPDAYRWIADDQARGSGARGSGSLAYQGVTLSLANFARLDPRGRVCAIQQSSIFVRVSIARLINERRRVAAFARLAARVPRVARLVRPLWELGFRRAQICLGHNQFVRLDVLEALGRFPIAGATEDSTLGYALAARGILLAPLPMLELTDLPETSEKMVRQNARWYQGVLDDMPWLWRAWRGRPSAFNLAQLVRHVGNKVVEWPVAAVVYPVIGFLGWHLAYRFSDRPLWFLLGIAFPSASLALSIWVGGIVTQDLVEELAGHCHRPVDVRRTTLGAKFRGTFRCQTYWLLATRGAWRVLWSRFRTGRFEAPKTDRVTRGPAVGVVVALVVVLAAAGCASYPMGLTKERWDALSPAEQAQYRARQDAIDAERRRAAEERHAQAMREAAERARLERARLETLHAAGRYGDVISVTITDGQMAFGGKRHAYEPVAFDLALGERRVVQVTREGHPHVTTLVSVRLSEDGNTFYFDEAATKRIVLVNDGWERGRVYHPHDVGRGEGTSGAAGIRIRIKLKELPGAPARVIIKER